VVVAPQIERYVAALVRLTVPAAARGDGDARSTAPGEDDVVRYVAYGSSPRGGQALLLGAKVRALLDGRAHVTVEDVDQIALAALRHRVVLNFAAEAAAVAPAQIIESVLAKARRMRA
jgi:MoxR-like ATPase